MLALKKIGEFVGKWFALIVVAAGAIALATPDTFAGWGAAIPWLLTVIMLGMGMTLRPVDFVIIGKRPWALIFGVLAHYTVMPALGWGIAHALNMSPVLTAGMILVGCAPAGTSSNVMVFLAKGDTALSVAMSSVSTLIAPVMTPLLVLLLVGEDLPVSGSELFVDIVKIVLVPVLLGLVLRLLFPTFVDRIVDVLPLISVAGVTGVVLAVVAGSASTLTSVGFTIVVAVMLHNLGGLTLGYAIGNIFRLPKSSVRAVTLEVGMQNSGLAAALATAHFAPAAALPAAIFSVWHNVSGSLLATFWSRRPIAQDLESTQQETSV
jgi:BASS family bile acid:Na+ symporter